MKIDFNAQTSVRDKFAMVAVDIYLAKPLMGHVQVEKNVQRIDYEGLPFVCYTCRLVSHSSLLCLTKRKKETDKPKEKDNVLKEPIQDNADGSNAIPDKEGG